MGVGMNKEEVPLAFPHKWERDDGSTVIAYGATLRDYFAAKAMNGILESAIDWFPTKHEPDENSLQVFRDLAKDSYHIADAMLKAREQ